MGLQYNIGILAGYGTKCYDVQIEENKKLERLVES